MTVDNLPATRRATAPALADTDSWVEVIGPVADLAQRIADTDFVPRGLRGKPAAVTAALLYGREVGLPPMTSLTLLHVVEGRPSMEAAGMRALILAAGHDFEVVEASGAAVTVRGRRRGSETWTSVTWSVDMARMAGLLGKSNWKSYPRAMLAARATAELARLVFPDVIHGFRALEELDDVDVDEAPALEGTAPAPATTRVARKRTATRRPAAAPASLPAAVPPQPRTDAPRVPLPGEDGAEDLTAPGPSPRPDSVEASALEGDRPPAPGVDAPPPAEEPAEELVDAELVEEPPPAEDRPTTPPRAVSRAQLRMMHSVLGGLGVEDREERLAVVGQIANRRVESTNDLTVDEAGAVIDTVSRCKSRQALDALLERTARERAGS